MLPNTGKTTQMANTKNVREINETTLAELDTHVVTYFSATATIADYIKSFGLKHTDKDDIEVIHARVIAQWAKLYFKRQGVKDADAAFAAYDMKAAGKRTKLETNCANSCKQFWFQMRILANLNDPSKVAAKRAAATTKADDAKEAPIVIEAVHVPKFASTADLITFCLAFADIMERAQKDGEKYAIGGISATMTDCVTSLREVCEANREAAFAPRPLNKAA